MTFEESLVVVSRRFVRRAFRDRFVHEAVRKPSRLMSRVCHDINLIFDEKYKEIIYKIGNDEKIYSLLMIDSEFSMRTWGEIEPFTKCVGGGILAWGVEGDFFYAETEGEPPTVYGSRP